MSLPIALGCIIAALVVGCILGGLYRKKVSEREIGSAEEKAKQIINDAYKSAESKRRETLLEAKEEIHKSRSEYEREVKERRAELQKQERRLQQKEESLDKKQDAFERKEDELTKQQGFYDKNPGTDIAVKALSDKKPTINSLGLRIGNFVQIRNIIDEELEAVWCSKKTAKQALDAAGERGNAELARFAKANKK